MKILMLGAGGVGGYFGGRLAQSGADVAFLVRPGRRDQLLRDGLVLRSPLGDAVTPVRALTADQVSPGYDLVILTCKAYDLDAALDAISPAMNGDCAVLPLLNGMEQLGRLDARFGAAAVMGGTCQINVNLGSDGVVTHTAPLNRLLFGERDRTRRPRAQALSALLAKTTIDWAWSDDIEQDMWEKMTFLAAFAAATCLFRGNVAEILAAPEGRALATRCYRDLVAIATAEGHAPRPPMLSWSLDRLTTPGPQSSSMLRDLEAGRPVEADHVVGHALTLARAHGIDDTILSLAYTHLKTYEARRAVGRLR